MELSSHLIKGDQLAIKCNYDRKILFILVSSLIVQCFVLKQILVFSPFVASGPGRCKINDGGCWHAEKNGHAFSACLVRDFFELSCV